MEKPPGELGIVGIEDKETVYKVDILWRQW
jgi:hypothetical protein